MSAAEADQHAANESDHGLIEFLKEQQWAVPFGTTVVEIGSLIESIEVAGRIDTRLVEVPM